MRRSFWKAAGISLAVYTGAVAAALWGGFPFLLFAVPVLQITWTLFCIIRIVQLRRTEPFDRESYGFALGGSISSTASLAVLVVLSQVV